MSEKSKELLEQMQKAYEATGQTEFEDVQYLYCSQAVLKEMIDSGHVTVKKNVNGTLIYHP